MLSRALMVQLHHNFREGNQAADHLAKLATVSPDSWQLFLDPPSTVQNILELDAQGTATHRCVAQNNNLKCHVALNML